MNRNFQIYTRHQNGERAVDLAHEFNLTRAMIYRICSEQKALVAGGADLPARLEAAKFDLLKWRAINEEMGATLADLRLKVERHELIPRAEVRETFNRVFAPYRQGVKEVARRYGPDSAQIIADLVNGALEKKT